MSDDETQQRISRLEAELQRLRRQAGLAESIAGDKIHVSVSGGTVSIGRDSAATQGAEPPRSAEGQRPPPLDPQTLDELWQQALAAFFSERYAVARPLLETINTRNPGHEDVAEKLSETLLYLTLQARYAVATRLRAEGNAHATLRALDDLRRRQPDFPDPQNHRAWAERTTREAAALARYAPGLQWCPVPAGPFLHGSSDADPLASDDEKPQRELVLPGFRIAKHPVTNAQWQRFVDEGGYREQSCWSTAGWELKQQAGWTQPRFWDDPQYARFNGPNQPVVGVSWYEASAYCAWLTTKLGYQVRLPSEAEWEKAARGTDGRIYPWGNTWQPEKLNAERRVGATTPVGSYPEGASPCGALDMAGNVWEWTATPWHDTLEKSTVVELSTGSSFVVRGGAWYLDLLLARCADRCYYNPDVRNFNLGLRVASALALTE
jgi:formylglycine-generating enzyme required for sulfatase activity